MKCIYYIIDENKNVVSASASEWENFRKTGNRIIKQEDIGNYFISTVFIGIDCNFDDNFRNKYFEPDLFETMIFEGDDGCEIYCTKYSTWKEAEEGHIKAIEWVKNGCK